MRIRLACADDLPRLQEIENAADLQFADVGLPVGEPRPLEGYARYLPDRLLVALDEAEHPVGFAFFDVLDGCAHLEQLAVDPPRQRRGIGTALIEAAAAWARERSLPALTLSTYRDVEWNGPYYARRGFHELADRELTPGLRRLRRREEDFGLDVCRRCCMRLDLSPVE